MRHSTRYLPLAFQKEVIKSDTGFCSLCRKNRVYFYKTICKKCFYKNQENLFSKIKK